MNIDTLSLNRVAQALVEKGSDFWGKKEETVRKNIQKFAENLAIEKSIGENSYCAEKKGVTFFFSSGNVEFFII